MIPLEGIDLLALQSSLKLGRDSTGATIVWDPLRKKYIRTNPEEMVRQLWIIYLLEILKLNRKLIAVERAFHIMGMRRRFDLVVFDALALPVLLAEFKGPEIPVRQTAFDQISRYNMQLHVPYSLISNGTMHYCFKIDDDRKEFVWQERLPFLEL